MKAVVFRNKKISIEDIPLPQPKSGEVLIKVSLAGICNTDVEISHGYMDYQGVLGHEFVGVVEKAEQEDYIGKRVIGEINLSCGNCNWCRNGLERHCLNRDVLGILNKDGAMAEYVTLPLGNIHFLDNSISDLQAVFTEPLAAAFEILEQISIGEHPNVLILGDGKLVQLIAPVVRMIHENILVVGKHGNKLRILQEFGISVFKLEDFKPKLFSLVIDATGSEKGLKLAIECTQPRGKLVLKSTISGNYNIDLAPIVINEISVIGSRCGPFEPALLALQNSQIKVDDLISKIYPLAQAVEAFEHAKQPEALKILLDMRS